MELRKIEKSNLWKVIKLSVDESQKSFVATNNESILEAYITITNNNMALPFALYEKDSLVGFIMFGYGTIEDEEEPSIAKDNYCIWRLMIDRSFQGKGHGGRITIFKDLSMWTSRFCLALL